MRKALSVWKRDSGGGLVLASWHSPHSLTWQWCVSFQRFSEGSRWRLPRWHRHKHNCGWQGHLTVPLLGFVIVSRQRPMWYRDLYAAACERHQAEVIAQYAAGRSKGFVEGIEARGVTLQ